MAKLQDRLDQLVEDAKGEGIFVDEIIERLETKAIDLRRAEHAQHPDTSEATDQ